MCGRSLQAITTGKLTPKSDIYSLGILLWELLTKETAYASLERHGVLFTDAGSYVAKSLVVPKLPVGTPPGVASLIESCWNLVRTADRRLLLRMIRTSMVACWVRFSRGSASCHAFGDRCSTCTGRQVEDDRPTVDAVLSQLRHLSDTLGEPELQFVNSGHWGCGTQDRMITVNRALFR